MLLYGPIWPSLSPWRCTMVYFLLLHGDRLEFIYIQQVLISLLHAMVGFVQLLDLLNAAIWMVLYFWILFRLVLVGLFKMTLAPFFQIILRQV